MYRKTQRTNMCGKVRGAAIERSAAFPCFGASKNAAKRLAQTALLAMLLVVAMLFTVACTGGSSKDAGSDTSTQQTSNQSTTGENGGGFVMEDTATVTVDIAE